MGVPSDAALLELAAELSRRGEPFALATVVRRTVPNAAQVGQRAILRPDGVVAGWLGGQCVDGVVRREARAALRERTARLVVIAPEGRSELSGARVYPMNCHSGGTVEIYIEPHLPAPALVVFGEGPVAEAVAAIGETAGFRLVEGAGSGEVDAEDWTDLYAVVAGMGGGDEDAARRALEAGAVYVGVVASPRRAFALRRGLEEAGVAFDTARLVSPAGLDLGARDPGEIAVSIVAQIVERRRSGVSDEAHAGGSAGELGTPCAPRPATAGRPERKTAGS